MIPRGNLRTVSAGGLITGSIMMVAVSLAVLLMAENAVIWTLKKPTFPTEPGSFIDSCYDAIERRNRVLHRRDPRSETTGGKKTRLSAENAALDAVEDALLEGLVGNATERCLTLANLSLSADPVSAPKPAPPQWLHEESQIQREYLIQTWSYRILWIGLPLLGIILGSTCILIGLKQIELMYWWPRLLLCILLAVFAWLVWPTPYTYISGPQGAPMQVNRSTGEVKLLPIGR